MVFRVGAATPRQVRRARLGLVPVKASVLLRVGLAVFVIGVGVYYFGGDEYRVPAVVIQVAGALAETKESRRI